MLRMAYKLGSLFDGSGGFPRAGTLCGIEPVWASEVEPYPIAVTKSRFPKMIHLGDITKVNGAEIEPVDIVTFGSPCQDLSVAGKRAGLKHEENGDDETTRSGLFMESIRIIKEMRCATNGAYPRFAFWENVPGAFSSNKGEAFRIVLEELIKIVEPTAKVPAPDKNGWAYADVLLGDGWSLAYRTFDAQYWGKSIRDRSTGTLRRRGTPQRRRRIHLVADFGGECAGKILFEREGLRGYSTQSRTPWQGVATDAQRSIDADDREGAINIVLDDQGGSQINVRTDGKAPTLRAETHGNLPCVIEAAGFDMYNQQSTGNVSRTLKTPVGGDDIPVVYAIENHPADSRVNIDDSGKVQTLTSRMGTGGGNVPMVMEPVYCLQGNGIDRADTAGCNGKGVKEDVSYTLNTIDRHAVAFSFDSLSSNSMKSNNPHSGCREVEVSKTLDCFDPTPAKNQGGIAVVEKIEEPIVLDRAFYNQGQNAQYEPQFYQDGTVPTLVARGPSAVCEKKKLQYIVRRLTPTECARLQGFPDDWGHPDVKTELSDEDFAFWHEVRNTHERINGKKIGTYNKDQMLKWYNKLHTDSAEYKMWGNGIALPPALYVMQGIVDALNERCHHAKES